MITNGQIFISTKLDKLISGEYVYFFTDFVVFVLVDFSEYFLLHIIYLMIISLKEVNVTEANQSISWESAGLNSSFSAADLSTDL